MMARFMFFLILMFCYSGVSRVLVTAAPSQNPGLVAGAPVAKAAPPAAASVPNDACPTECTCHEAPLHAAPFVHMWLRNWAQSDLPELSENEALDEGAVAAAYGPAADAGVEVTRHGLHATCALYPDTNLTDTLHGLPQHTMVLSVLQAAGSNYTVIEGNQLVTLSNLRALNIQGFAPNPNRQRAEQYIGNTLPRNKQNENIYEQTSIDLTMALADDALQSLINLEVLDLQYVRLVANIETQRSRRHTWGPVSTTTMVDMPLRRFLSYANDLESVQLPRGLNTREKNIIEAEEELTEDEELIDENYIIIEDNFDDESEEDAVGDEVTVVLLNSTEREEPVPYTIFNANSYDFFAPFMSQNMLKYLRIANAHLDKLGPELLGGLTNLHTFTLEHNDIRVLPANVFAPTPSIRHLSIAHNSILSLDSKSLQGLPNLLTLDLEYNKITIIGSGSLPRLPKLRSLKLAGNPIRHILPDSFLGVNATDTLTVGSPGVSSKIHDEAFRHLQNLKTLQINNVSSESFQESLFSGISQLEDLTLHGNIIVIDYDAFISISKLKHLVISHCALSRISVDAFFGLSKLVSLDMSYNNLLEITPGVFDHLSSLTELYIHDNHLSTLPVGLFAPLPLRVLRLNHNPWDCSCNLLQLHPSITNSVIQNGYNLCRHDSKSNTVCNKIATRIVYDARVAPQCLTPGQYRNKDVYTVAEKYLKCSKYHWDPLQYTEDPRPDVNFVDKNVKMPPTQQTPANFEDNFDELLQSDESSDVAFNMNWEPLSAFTPVPIRPLDLLNIAENEMLEEAIEEATSPPTAPRTDIILQDATMPLTKDEQKRRMAESRAQYRAKKQKIKQKLQFERAREAQKLLKKSVWNQIGNY